MTLKLEKLQELLIGKGYVLSNYFVLDGSCFCIELLHRRTGISYLLYIPSKYDFPMTAGGNVYNMSYIDMTVKDPVDDYAGNSKAEEEYSSAGIQIQGKDMENQLEDGYKKEITLGDVAQEDQPVLRSIHRQMRRLKQTVMNIDYKIAVMYKNYICMIRRDNSIDCILVKNFPKNSVKKMYVVTDLEVLYEKGNQLMDDILTVEKSVHQVLEKNQGTHTNIIDRISLNQKEAILTARVAESKNTHYDGMIEKYKNLLDILVTAEEKVRTELSDLDRAGITGLQSDIARAHQRSKLEKELSKIQALQSDINKCIHALRGKKENTILSLDDILFDNNIMFDKIVRNFARLKEI